ncbi:hypothetical protein [Nostoc sp. NIES-3756]|nr:hypothetical protein [Nostoc sp. NIES-3756]
MSVVSCHWSINNDPSGMPSARQGRTPVPYGGKPAYRTGLTNDQ